MRNYFKSESSAIFAHQFQKRKIIVLFLAIRIHVLSLYLSVLLDNIILVTGSLPVRMMDNWFFMKEFGCFMKEFAKM